MQTKDPTFIAKPGIQPDRRWVIHAELEYPGDVMVAAKWESRWGEPLSGGCFLRLTDKITKEEVDEALTALEEALGQQGRRISAFAIHHVLEQPETALVDKFLQLGRAADLDALADVLDDRVLSFLRTFLGQP